MTEFDPVWWSRLSTELVEWVKYSRSLRGRKLSEQQLEKLPVIIRGEFDRFEESVDEELDKLQDL